MLVTGAMLHDDGTAGIVIVLDISDRKRAEEDLRRLNLELEEHVRRRTADLEAANTELESFSYSVSHDLRAPLRHIAGFAELLREHVVATDEESEHFIDVITRAASDMGILIDDLLQFSRVGRAEMRVGQVDMEQLVREALERRPERPRRAAGGGLRRRDRAGGGRPHASPSGVGQPHRQRLQVHAHARAGRDRDRVADSSPESWSTGCVTTASGSTCSTADRLFRVFERLHRSDEFEGTGIGLANVSRIVGRHGGRCWVEAEEDVGATFFFSLPAGRERMMDIDLRPILLAEDDPRDVELTLQALRGPPPRQPRGGARDGVETLKYLRESAKAGAVPGLPAVLLLDIKMPRLTGLDVLAEIRSDPDLKNLPVVMLTSSREGTDLQAAYELGANAYVVKPVGFNEFIDAVRQVGAFWALLNEPAPMGQQQ